MRKLWIPLVQNNRAVSYTISALIITATTITLVLVASIYAYQVLEQQRGATEFDIAKESILVFNDALENVAWKQGAVRSSRFTIEYGYLELTPNGTQYGNTVNINATMDGNTTTLYSNSAGFIRYYLSTNYISFGQGYESYIIGSNSTLIAGSTGSYGRAVVEQSAQQQGWVTITLDYRTRAMRTSVINVTTNGTETPVNYVDIWVIKLVTSGNVTSPVSYVHDFNLKASCLSIQTITSGPYDVPLNNISTISVQIGDVTSSADVSLVDGKVVFNVIVSEVQVSV